MTHPKSVFVFVAALLSLLSSIVLSPAMLQAQPTISWQKAYGGDLDDKAFSVIQTSDGGYVFAGSTMSNNGDVSGLHNNGNGDGDIWVVRTNSAGTIIWQKVYGGTGDDVAHCVIQTRDGGFAIAGTTGSRDGDIQPPSEYHGGTGDAWILKLNSDGSLKWQKCYGGSQSDGARSIVQTYDDNYVFAGFSSSKDGDLSRNFGGNDFWIAKIDTLGGLLWSKTYGGSDDDELNAIINTSDSGLAVAGYTASTDSDIHQSQGQDDFWVMKMTRTGSKVWGYTFGGDADDEATSLVQNNDGGFTVAGYTNSDTSGIVNKAFGSYDYWVIRINRNGAVGPTVPGTWSHSYGGTRLDEANTIVKTLDGGYVVAGETYSNDSEVTSSNNITGVYSDEWIVKLNASGKLLWQRAFGGSNNDEAWSIFAASDTGYVIAGETKSSNGDAANDGYHAGYDVWIVKTTPDTSGRPIAGVASDLAHLTTGISLFPNPTNGRGNIEYTLSKSDDVKIEIYNAIGQRVQLLTNELQYPGNHEQGFDLSALPSGQYFFHFQTALESKVQGMQLLR